MTTMAQGGVKKKIRLFIVDDHPIVSEGLRSVISKASDMMVCGSAFDGRHALDAVAKHDPDIVITDLSKPGVDGLEFIRLLKTRRPAPHIIVFSSHDGIGFVRQSLKMGATGYVIKTETPENILKAIRKVMEGKVYVSEALSDRLFSVVTQRRQNQYWGVDEVLSARELEVFRMIGEGHTTREIAEKCHIGVKTIETHRRRIKEKLSIKHNTELIRQATLCTYSRPTDPKPVRK